MKIKTRAQIKREVKALRRQLYKIYNELDNLSDEAQISYNSLTEKQVMKGNGYELKLLSKIISEANLDIENAYEHLKCIE